MKKSILAAISAICLLITSCKKDNSTSQHIGFSIKLSDKPLDTIKKYIQGRWKFEYAFGGIGNTIYYPPNTYVTYSAFTSNNRVLSISNSLTNVDTTIEWTKGMGVALGDGDSTYTMKYYDKHGVPWVYVVSGISNDTLIYHDYSADAMFYHYSKSN